MRVENRSVTSLSGATERQTASEYEDARGRRGAPRNTATYGDVLDATELALLLLDTHRMLELRLFIYEILLPAPIIVLFLVLVVRPGY